MNITLSLAEAAIKAAKEKSKEPGTLMNIAVVDAGTNLVDFVHRAVRLKMTMQLHPLVRMQ